MRRNKTRSGQVEVEVEEGQPSPAMSRKDTLGAIESVEYLVLPSVQCTHPIYRHRGCNKYTKHGLVHKQVCLLTLESTKTAIVPT